MYRRPDIVTMPACYAYIILCKNGSYYTGSTRIIKLRYSQHVDGTGANHTRKYGVEKLAYLEEFTRIDHAFQREHQIKRWSRAKKEALINSNIDELKRLSKKVFGG